MYFLGVLVCFIIFVMGYVLAKSALYYITKILPKDKSYKIKKPGYFITLTLISFVWSLGSIYMMLFSIYLVTQKNKLKSIGKKVSKKAKKELPKSMSLKTYKRAVTGSPDSLELGIGRLGGEIIAYSDRKMNIYRTKSKDTTVSKLEKHDVVMIYDQLTQKDTTGGVIPVVSLESSSGAAGYVNLESLQDANRKQEIIAVLGYAFAPKRILNAVWSGLIGALVSVFSVFLGNKVLVRWVTLLSGVMSAVAYSISEIAHLYNIEGTFPIELIVLYMPLTFVVLIVPPSVIAPLGEYGIFPIEVENHILE